MAARINVFILLFLAGFIPWAGPASAAVADPFAPPQFEIWEPPSPRLHRSESISSITQTQDGYLWLGTARGAIRFDGRSSRIFNPDTAPEIRGYSIADLIRDPREGLWILTDRGSLSYHLRGAIRRIGRNEGMPAMGIVAAVPGEGGLLALTAPNRLLRLKDSAANGAIIQGLPEGSRVRGLQRDHQGNIWILATQDAGLTLLQLRDNRAIPTDLALSIDAKIAPSRSGGVLIVSDREVIHYNGESSTRLTEELPFPEQGSEITAAFESMDGLLWIGSRTQGLFVYSPTQDAVYSPRELGFEFRSRRVSAIFQDREYHIWISDGDGALHRIRRRIFETLPPDEARSSFPIRSICEAPDGSIWIGSAGGGLVRRKDGKVHDFDAADGLEGAEIQAVCAAPAGTIWAAVRNHGLYFSRNGKRFIKAKGLPSVAINALYVAPDGTLWVGTNDQGLFRRGAGAFEPVDITREDGPFEERSVSRVLADADGVVWAATNGGGLKRIEGDDVTHFEHAPEDPTGLPSNYIFALALGAEGNLWIGASRGLCRHDGSSFRSVRMADNLNGSHIYDIFEDGLQQLWLTSDEGILRIKKPALENYFEGVHSQVRCAVFDEADGLRELPSNTHSQPSSWQAKDGRLWIPTGAQATILDPARMAENPRAPAVVIEELRADNTTYDLSQPIVIPPGVSELSIRFAGISFADPHRVTFSRRLEGFEPDWIHHRGIGLAVYDDLRPGRYVFQLKAANKDGVETPGLTTLEFELLPPFWRTTWFLGLMIGVLLLLVRYISIRKIRDRLRYLLRERALEGERARIAKDMHDDLGANLTQISLMGELLRRNPDNPTEVEKNAARIAERSRLVSQKLDEIVWAVNPKNDSLDKLATYLVHFAEEFLEPADIRCRLEVPPKLPDRPVDSELRHSIFMGVKEAMNNAVKYSDSPEIRLRMALSGNEFKVSVEDDGVGFDPAAASGTGSDGLANMRKRAEEHGGRFEILSEAGKGTTATFIFRLPG